MTFARRSDRLDRGRDRLVRTILPPRGGLLFAVHNNSEGYSVRDGLHQRQSFSASSRSAARILPLHSAR